MDPGICAILNPVWQDSVGNETDLHGILLVCVNVPQTDVAADFAIGMIFMALPSVS